MRQNLRSESLVLLVMTIHPSRRLMKLNIWVYGLNIWCSVSFQTLFYIQWKLQLQLIYKDFLKKTLPPGVTADWLAGRNMYVCSDLWPQLIKCYHGSDCRSIPIQFRGEKGLMGKVSASSSSSLSVHLLLWNKDHIQFRSSCSDLITQTGSKVTLSSDNEWFIIIIIITESLCDWYCCSLIGGSSYCRCLGLLRSNTVWIRYA